ncbi:hypothetical protein EYF80_019131 [Liparis tanakae]|uniref:Uncharacterized protein n=1 Tax=Liparis tanakae TaxID=230148 RepID=A0A4Z2I088_9TELE|nr:hypothetical protein EYF80_019131 [Liparis tanakae]
MEAERRRRGGVGGVSTVGGVPAGQRRSRWQELMTQTSMIHQADGIYATSLALAQEAQLIGLRGPPSPLILLEAVYVRGV